MCQGCLRTGRPGTACRLSPVATGAMTHVLSAPRAPGGVRASHLVPPGIQPSGLCLCESAVPTWAHGPALSHVHQGWAMIEATVTRRSRAGGAGHSRASWPSMAWTE